jgi:hypothetical protein
MAPKRGNDGEECMQSPLTSTCPSYQITDTSPASHDNKRQKMREQSRSSAAAAAPEIHVVHGPVVNSYGHLFEAMSGML